MKREQAVTAVIAALPPLVVAAAGWLQADAKAREAQAAKGETARAYESYGEYTTEQLYRDEALLKALRDCQERDPRSWHDLVAEGPIVAKRMAESVTEPQAQVVLDEVARAQGWTPEKE